MPSIITSAANAVLKKLLTLHSSKGIKSHGEFLVGGPRLIQEIYAGSPDAITAWIGTERMLASGPANLPATIPRVVLSPERFNELNVFGTPGPLLTCRLPNLPAFNPGQPWPKGCTLFIPFGDPDNVGAVIRSAAGLGAARVVLTTEAAFPFLPKALRASAGAVCKIPLERGPALAELALIENTPLFALDVSGTPLIEVRRPQCFGLIMGMEGQGLPPVIRQKTLRIAIPMFHEIESLNAAAAAAIALWEWRPRKADAG